MKHSTTFPVAVNIFVLRESKLLLGKRKNDYGAGSWSLPGGHVAFGEDLEKTAARKLQGETGMEASGFSFQHILNDHSDDQHRLQAGFLALEPRGEPGLKEPDFWESWNWFEFESLPEVIPARREQITLFQKGVTFGNF